MIWRRRIEVSVTVETVAPEENGQGDFRVTGKYLVNIGGCISVV